MRSKKNRPLSRSELTLLKWLLEHGTERAPVYAEQLPHLQVISHCGCGCPSVDLSVRGEVGSGGSEIVADYIGVTPEGLDVGILLHARDGKLAELEVYCFG